MFPADFLLHAIGQKFDLAQSVWRNKGGETQEFAFDGTSHLFLIIVGKSESEGRASQINTAKILLQTLRDGAEEGGLPAHDPTDEFNRSKWP